MITSAREEIPWASFKRRLNESRKDRASFLYGKLTKLFLVWCEVREGTLICGQKRKYVFSTSIVID